MLMVQKPLQSGCMCPCVNSLSSRYSCAECISSASLSIPALILSLITLNSRGHAVPEEQRSHQYWSQRRCCCCVHCGASCCYDNSNRCMCQPVYSRQLQLLYTLDSALRCPLIAVPASPPTHIYNSYILQCIRLLQLQLVLLPLLPFICLSGVPLLYTTVPPTPPAVWPTPCTPGAAFPAGTMPHTLMAVATAPTSCVGGDYR